MNGDKINGRTPEEIKLGLVHCLTAREYRNCLVCPYETPRKRGMLPCDCEVRQDILALIDQLLEDKKQLIRERDEARNDLDTLNYANTELHSVYEAMKREHDMAVELLHGFCGACANEGKHEICVECSRRLPFEPEDKDDYWQWRGVQEVE